MKGPNVFESLELESWVGPHCVPIPLGTTS